jgi:Tol biopolymer transport system component
VIVGSSSLPTFREVYLIGANEGNLVRLTYNQIISSSPTFSSDGQKIMFYSIPSYKDPFYEELKIINSDGTNETILAKGWGIARLAKFSSDSQKALFVFRGDLYMVDIYKAVLTRLTYFNIKDIDRPDKVEGLLFIDTFALSPSGDEIIFVAKERNCLRFIFYSMNVDGSGMRQINILDNPDRRGYLGYIAEMKYSPDGKKITFVGHFKNRPFYVLDENDNLNFVRDLYGIDSGIENIENDLFVFTPDSRQILFVAAFPYGLSNDWFAWIKSIGYEIFGNLKYFIFRKISGSYDNKYLCIMDIKTGNLKKITKLPVSSNLGRDFIHWEE